MKYLSAKKVIELLDEGRILFTPGSNLDRLEKVENGYKWGGMADKAPTILSKQEVVSLVPNRKWGEIL